VYGPEESIPAPLATVANTPAPFSVEPGRDQMICSSLFQSVS
jgi:hypothetical protein